MELSRNVQSKNTLSLKVRCGAPRGGRQAAVVDEMLAAHSRYATGASPFGLADVIRTRL